MATNDAAVENEDGEDADPAGLSVTIDVDDDGDFEESLVALVEREVVEPMDGIDLDGEAVTLESIERADDGGYRVSFSVRG